MRLVELCAGSATISMDWLGADPPLGYEGGKRAYRRQIAEVLGLQRGAGHPSDVLLVEPGPWGEAWALWRSASGRRDTIRRLRSWEARDPRDLWEELRQAPVPRSLGARVAAWAVLQLWSYNRSPIYARGRGWRGGRGFNTCEAYRRSCAAAKGWAETAPDVRLGRLIARLECVPDLAGLEVRVCSAQEVVPFPCLCLIDPPYQGTVTDYGFELPRAAVIALARRWHAAGAVVAVCERERVVGRGVDLGSPRGQGRSLAGRTREVLSLMPECAAARTARRS